MSSFSSMAVWTPIIITLVSGTVSGLANKIAYDTKVNGTCPSDPPPTFQKAYFFTLIMFLGEALCLAIYYAKQGYAKYFGPAGGAHGADAYQTLEAGSGQQPTAAQRLRAVNELSQPLRSASFVQAAGGDPLSPPADEAGPKKPPVWVYAVLCCIDLSATSIGGVGLIWVDASTNQMLRGSMVVFSAFFSVLMLKRKLSGTQWSSIAIVCMGLGMVGLAGLLKQHFDPSTTSDSGNVTPVQMLLGIALVLLASALNAAQNVFEEKLLKAVGGAEVDPLELVGWEGVFGSILCCVLLLPVVGAIPGSDCGKQEDTLNTLKQLGNSPLVLGMSLSFMIGLCLMNWTSQQISQQLSAVHRNLVSAVRTVLVWVIDLILFYQIAPNSEGKHVYGEEWTNWSFIELGGFFLLVGGTILYSYFGLKLAAEQRAHEMEEQLITGASPEYALPHDPTLGEHAQIIKQQSKHSLGNGSGRNGGVAMAHSYNSNGNGVYDQDD